MAQEGKMKRSTTLINVVAALVVAAPAAMAGNIVKCVAPDGHVTLTDQPCATGASTVQLEQGQEIDRDRATPAPQRHVLPAAQLRQGAWRRPDLSQPLPLKSDVATLKAARRTLMMQDAKPSLAAE
jgi:hypothetical protein